MDGTHSRMPPRPSTPGRHRAPSGPPEASGGDLARLFPIVRARRNRRGRYEMLRLDAWGIAVWEARRPLTDVVARPPADGRPTTLLTPWAGVGRVAARCVREGPKRWCEFDVAAASGRRAFRVPVAHVPNVLWAFGAMLGDRYDPAASPVGGRPRNRYLPPCLAGAGVAAGAALAAVAPCPGTAALLFAVPALLFVLARLRADARERSAVRPKRRKRRRRAAGRKPYRSWAGGCLVKLFGAGILVGVFLLARYGRFPAMSQANLGRQQYFVFLVVCAYGVRLILRGYEMSVRVFEPGEHPSRRPPVLYLRDFESDGQLSLQPATALARLHGVRPRWDDSGQHGSWRTVLTAAVFPALLPFHPVRLLRMFLDVGADTAAEVFARSFFRVGPLVAIGRPGDAMAEPGADQMYVADDRWRQVVLDYLGRSRAVVLMPTGSPGVVWETDQVMRRYPRHRVLLCMAKFRRNPDDYETFRARLDAEHGVRLPASVPFRPDPCFVYFEADGTVRLQDMCLRSPVLWPLTGNAIDWRRTFRSFVDGLAGGPQPPPAEPRRFLGHGAVSLAVLAALLLGLYLLPAICECGLYYATAGAIDIRQGAADGDPASPAPAPPASVPPAPVPPAPAAARGTPPAAVVPRGEPAGESTTRYVGRQLGYEFRLGDGWVRVPVAPDDAVCEYEFAYRRDVGTFTVDVGDDEFAGERDPAEHLRALVEKGLQARFGRRTTVRIASSRAVREDGTDWLAVRLARRYPAGAEKTQWVRIYRSAGKCLMLSVVLPTAAEYDALAGAVLASARVTGGRQPRPGRGP